MGLNRKIIGKRISGIFTRSSFIIAVVMASFIWSASYIATKTALVDFPPLTLAALRFIIASLILSLVMISRGKYLKPTRGDLARLF